MSDLTPKQQRLLNWIETYIDEHRYSPTYRQMQQAMDLRSVAPIQSLLNQLEAKGYIQREEGQARTLRLLQTRPKGVPILGTIAASGLVEVFPETMPEYIPLEVLAALHGVKRDWFALRVSGDSMIGALIAHNDVVILRPSTDPQLIKPGTIVAARVGDKTTLKQYYCDGQTVWLVPANPNYPEMKVDAAAVEIQGIYVALLRDLI